MNPNEDGLVPIVTVKNTTLPDFIQMTPQNDGRLRVSLVPTTEEYVGTYEVLVELSIVDPVNYD